VSLKRALKGAERLWRRAVMAVLLRLLPHRRGAIPDWTSRRHRVLFLRYDRIGDMILATGVLRAIKQAQPSVSLHVLASPSNVTILDGNPHVERVHVFERRSVRANAALFWRLRRERYDVVLDGMVLDPSLTALLLMLATGAPYRVGIGGRRNDAVYTLPVAPAPPESQVIRQLAALATPFGVDTAAADLRSEIPLRDAERLDADRRWRSLAGSGPRLLVNVAATGAERHWPRESFAAALREISHRVPDANIIVAGAPGHEATLDYLAQTLGVSTAMAGLRGTLALVSVADVILTPDTSLSHAAAAFGTPAVVMFTLHKAMFVPYEIPAINLVSGSETLATLEPLEVARAVERLIEETRASRRS
jgi:ADP-heptose:LPS heptosyltransferase